MSTNPRIYLDFNATAPLSAAVCDALAHALAGPPLGNPSSIHAEGRHARDLVERARNAVAARLGRPREQIVFTSGGSEGNQLGVLGLAAVVEARGSPRVVAGAAIDHPSLRGAIDALVRRGWTERPLAVDAQGRITAETSLSGVGLVAFGLVNHELGTIADAVALVHAARVAGALVHVDAVQAAGKLALGDVDADALAISGHKLGAPPGIGALALALDEALPLVDGGHQERGRRAGTENVLGIVGLGAAIAASDPADWPGVVALGERLEAGLCALEGVRIHGRGAARVGGTINAGFGGARGESLVVALDLAGIAVATGAACTSGSVQPSRVLLALGHPADAAREAVRFSLGRTTTPSDIDRTLAALAPILVRARAHRQNRT